MWVHMVNGQCFRCLNIFSACSETRNCNNSVCQHFSWLSKPLCYRKKRRKKKKKKRPSTRNTSCFSLARELNLATCSTWRWISQRASDSSCRPLTAARKSLFGLLLTEAQRSGGDAQRNIRPQWNTSRGAEGSAHIHQHNTCGLQRTCLGLSGCGKECASWLVNLLI